MIIEHHKLIYWLSTKTNPFGRTHQLPLVNIKSGSNSAGIQCIGIRQQKSQESYTKNAEYEPPSLTFFKLRHLKICEGGPLLRLFQKHIYKDQALALGVAHSVTGVEEMRRRIELALALALKLNDKPAIALALEKEVVN